MRTGNSYLRQNPKKCHQRNLKGTSYSKQEWHRDAILIAHSTRKGRLVDPHP